jgi:hypothetical protein
VLVQIADKQNSELLTPECGSCMSLMKDTLYPYKFAQTVVTLSAALLISGCSVFMAAKQPPKKNLSLFSAGTPRSLVLAEFGAPIDTKIAKNGEKVEVYKFTQGYSGGAKAGRAIFHGAADVFTIGLWEVAATPIEGMANGTEMVYEIKYGTDDKVLEAKNLKTEGVK